MAKKMGSAAPGSAKAAGGEKTSINFNMKPMAGTNSTPGSKNMGIPPFKQKAKNVQKLSSMAKDCKKVKGTDKYS